MGVQYISTLCMRSVAIADDLSPMTSDKTSLYSLVVGNGGTATTTAQAEDAVYRAETALQETEASLLRTATAEAAAEAIVEDAKHMYEAAVRSSSWECGVGTSGGGLFWRTRTKEEKQSRIQIKLLAKQSRQAEVELRRATMRHRNAQDQVHKANEKLKAARWTLMDMWRQRISDENSNTYPGPIDESGRQPPVVGMTVELHMA